MTKDSSQPVTVFYDGSCPLCTREIGLYQRALGGNAVNWCDISQTDVSRDGLSAEQAMARCHVRGPDGVMQDGARAFILLWLTVPRWRWLGRMASIPPLPSVLEGLYRAFLPIRPWLQRLARNRA
ncbi:MAG: thiol-disulfide oxidoreductase DCC family protein [Beijerinckiaceae bacterium]